MKTQLKKTKKSTASRTAKAVVCNRLVRRLMKIVTEDGKFAYGTATRCLDVVEHVFDSHRRMCNNLQTLVQKHSLGDAGMPVDEIVCTELESRLSENPAPMAEIEARIRAHTPPKDAGLLDQSDFRDLENLLLSLVRDSKRRAHEYRPHSLLWTANWADALHFSRLAKKAKNHANRLSA